ncbi:MAG: twin-arginine translocase TatA/TatE family subunit [Bacteroidia bacterium]
MNASIILGTIGPWQVVLILLVVVLLFGAKKIPELMKGVGQGIKEFKDAQKPEETNTNESERKTK